MEYSVYVARGRTFRDKYSRVIWKNNFRALRETSTLPVRQPRLCNALRWRYIIDAYFWKFVKKKHERLFGCIGSYVQRGPLVSWLVVKLCNSALLIDSPLQTHLKVKIFFLMIVKFNGDHVWSKWNSWRNRVSTRNVIVMYFYTLQFETRRLFTI